MPGGEDEVSVAAHLLLAQTYEVHLVAAIHSPGPGVQRRLQMSCAYFNVVPCDISST